MAVNIEELLKATANSLSADIIKAAEAEREKALASKVLVVAKEAIEVAHKNRDIYVSRVRMARKAEKVAINNLEELVRKFAYFKQSGNPLPIFGSNYGQHYAQQMGLDPDDKTIYEVPESFKVPKGFKI